MVSLGCNSICNSDATSRDAAYNIACVVQRKINSPEPVPHERKTKDITNVRIIIKPYS
jgi:hypothetical protein